jgi:hypothetical protein
VSNCEDLSNVKPIPYTCDFSEDPSHMPYTVHRAMGSSQLLGLLLSLAITTELLHFGISVKLKITSGTANFITQILSFLAFGGSSFVKL